MSRCTAAAVRPCTTARHWGRERERERESEIENEKARETPTREKMSDSQRLVRRETRNDKFLTLDSHSSTLKIDKS